MYTCTAIYRYGEVLLLPIINPRRACAARVTVVGSVCVCVCVSVKSHLTYGASVRPENAVTYSAGNEGQKICGVFSETAPLQRSSTPSVVRPCVQSAIFPCVFSCTRMRISRVYTRMIHRRGFSTLVLFISKCGHSRTHLSAT